MHVTGSRGHVAAPQLCPRMRLPHVTLRHACSVLPFLSCVSRRCVSLRGVLCRRVTWICGMHVAGGASWGRTLPWHDPSCRRTLRSGREVLGRYMEPHHPRDLLTHRQWGRPAVRPASLVSALQGADPMYCPPPGFFRADLRPKLMAWVSREPPPLHAPVHCASPWECAWQPSPHPPVLCHRCHLILAVWML